MIEMVYKGPEKGKNEDKLKQPKNVRQIGEVTKGKKVYLEDYAVTYLHQVEMAVLLGDVKQEGENSYIFIQGAVEVEEGCFGDGAWEAIYRDAKKYFPDSDILGWSQQVSEQPLMLSKEMDAMYKEHFHREHAVLILHEPYEKEDSLFLEENGALKKQNGYYIYYDKNKAMQEYMVDRNEGKSVEKEVEVKDSAIKSFRKLAEEKKAKRAEKAKEEPKAAVYEEDTEPKPQPQSQSKALPKTTRFLYAASTFLVLTVLVIGVTMINNYDKMKNMEATLAEMMSSTEGAVAANVDNDSQDEVRKRQNTTEAPNETDPVFEENTESAAEETETGTEDAQAAEESDTTDLNGAEAAPEGTDLNNEQAAAAEQPETTANAGNDEVQPASAAADHVSQSSYVVKAGDTLADICKLYYGSADRLDEICALNGIDDPNKILLGQKILLP